MLIGAPQNIPTLARLRNWRSLVFSALKDIPRTVHSRLVDKIYLYTINMSTVRLALI